MLKVAMHEWGLGYYVEVVESKGLDTGSVEAHVTNHHV